MTTVIKARLARLLHAVARGIVPGLLASMALAACGGHSGSDSDDSRIIKNDITNFNWTNPPL